MRIAFWCVLAMAVMPIVLAGLAKSRGDFDNQRPREWLAALEGWRRRANAAQANAWEAFAPFAAAVLVAHVSHARDAWIDGLAVAFVAARIAYAWLYIADRPSARSLAWCAGFGCVIGLFVVAAVTGTA